MVGTDYLAYETPQSRESRSGIAKTDLPLSAREISSRDCADDVNIREIRLARIINEVARDPNDAVPERSRIGYGNVGRRPC